MTPGDMRMLELALSDHLVDKFSEEILSGHIPEDFGARMTAEMTEWREDNGGMIPVNIDGRFQCHTNFSYPPDPGNPPIFDVKFVLYEPELEGWNDDPLEL